MWCLEEFEELCDLLSRNDGLERTTTRMTNGPSRSGTVPSRLPQAYAGSSRLPQTGGASAPVELAGAVLT